MGLICAIVPSYFSAASRGLTGGAGVPEGTYGQRCTTLTRETAARIRGIRLSVNAAPSLAVNPQRSGYLPQCCSRKRNTSSAQTGLPAYAKLCPSSADLPNGG